MNHSPTGGRATFTVATAELMRTLRDPHVVAYLFAPVVLYPLLFWGMLQLGAYEQGRLLRQGIRVHATGPAALVSAFEVPPFVPATGSLADGDLDLEVIGTQGAAGAWGVTIHHVSTRPTSRRGRERAEAVLDRLRAERVEDLTDAPAPRYTIERHAVDGMERFARRIVALLVGYIGTLAMLLSAIYPAIDLVVAERQRSTLETLLLAPIPYWPLLLGKAIAATTLVTLAALANMASLALTLAYLQQTVGQSTTLAFLPHDLLGMAMAMPTVVATAFLVATTIMVVVLPATTFKEGEMLATTAMVVGVLPGVTVLVSSIAGQTTGMVWLPVGNLALVVQEGLMGELTWSRAIGPALENAALGIVAFSLVAAVARRQDFLVGGRLPRWLAWIPRGVGRR